MSRCSDRCCSLCKEQLKTERKLRRAEIRAIAACSAGPHPSWDDALETIEKIPGLQPKFLEEDTSSNHIWVTTLHPDPQFIQATSSTSQKLAEAFYHNCKGTWIRPGPRVYNQV